MATSGSDAPAGWEATAPPSAFLDTNVLVYATQENDAHFAKAKALRDRAFAGGERTCLAPQILAEFYSVVTDRRRVAKPIVPSEAVAEIAT